MPASYYFEPRDPRKSLAAQLPILDDCLRAAADAEAPPSIRVRAALVQGALDDLAHAVRSRFLRDVAAGRQALLAAYRREHVAEKPSDPRSDVAPGG